jgi:hypothetical protein
MRYDACMEWVMTQGGFQHAGIYHGAVIGGLRVFVYRLWAVPSVLPDHLSPIISSIYGAVFGILIPECLALRAIDKGL